MSSQEETLRVLETLRVFISGDVALGERMGYNKDDEAACPNSNELEAT